MQNGILHILAGTVGWQSMQAPSPVPACTIDTLSTLHNNRSSTSFILEKPPMSDEGEQVIVEHTGSEGTAGKWVLILLAVIYVAGSLFFLFTLRSRIDDLGKSQTASAEQVSELGKRMQSAE